MGACCGCRVGFGLRAYRNEHPRRAPPCARIDREHRQVMRTLCCALRSRFSAGVRHGLSTLENARNSVASSSPGRAWGRWRMLPLTIALVRVEVVAKMPPPSLPARLPLIAVLVSVTASTKNCTAMTARRAAGQRAAVEREGGRRADNARVVTKHASGLRSEDVADVARARCGRTVSSLGCRQQLGDRARRDRDKRA